MRGSWRAKTRPEEPQPQAPIGSAPRHLGKAAKAVWRQVTKELAAMGVGRSPDRLTLERYCQQLVRARQCQAAIEQQGETYELLDDKGNVRCVQQRPEVAILNRLNASLLKLEQEFGLTPASRAKIKVEVQQPKQPEGKSRFFAG